MKAVCIRATSSDFVLDVGSGGYPHSTADVLVDRYIEDTLRHRSGRDLVRDRPTVQADITALPFKTKTFDYVIANQVIEHVEDPARALEELSRVGLRGYISVPSEFEEMICTSPAHLWVFARKGGELLIKRKQDRHELGISSVFGSVFWMLHENSDYRAFMLRYSNLFWVNFEWQGAIRYRVVSSSYQFYDYHNPVSVAPLLEPTYPGSLFEYIRHFLRAKLPLKKMYQLTRVRGGVRRVIKRVVFWRPKSRA